MQLSALLKTVKPLVEAGFTDPDKIREALRDIKWWTEGEDYTILPDGTIEEGPEDSRSDHYDIVIPPSWTRIPVKFGNFSGGSLKLYKSSLKSLENAPEKVHAMIISCSWSIASLRGSPQHIEHSAHIVSSGMTSLVGGPSIVNGSLFLSDLSRLSSLEGLQDTEVGGRLTIATCGVTSLEGMPKFIRNGLELVKLEHLKAIRIPKYVTLGHGGALTISPDLVIKLSPTLILVPSLVEIRCPEGYRTDIVELFNSYLDKPKTRRNFFELQGDLIEMGLGFMADL